MTVRIVILSFFVVFFALLWVPIYVVLGEVLWGPVVITGSGIVAIGYLAWGHIRFQLSDRNIVVKQPFRSARVIDLDQLTSWKALEYNIRGQRRKSVVLFLNTGKRTSLDNSIYPMEFDEVYSCLKEYFPAKKN